jgi:hypothetical protein
MTFHAMLEYDAVFWGISYSVETEPRLDKVTVYIAVLDMVSWILSQGLSSYSRVHSWLRVRVRPQVFLYVEDENFYVDSGRGYEEQYPLIVLVQGFLLFFPLLVAATLRHRIAFRSYQHSLNDRASASDQSTKVIANRRIVTGSRLGGETQ